MGLEDLPPELYDSILYHVPESVLQQTALSIIRALPRSPVPPHHLFQTIHLKHPEQAVQLHRTLRHQKPAAGWVKSIAIETWTVDADVVINVLLLLKNLVSFTIWIGPNNFTPEHLEELFVRPIGGLRYLALRFRPYVLKASYYQFLKGAYYDSTLLALSKWPPNSLPTLSIVQDPYESTTMERSTFAQPLVFHKFNFCISLLLHSPMFSTSLRALRLRVPARPVARALCHDDAAYDSQVTSRDPPRLRFLDLSTCGMLEDEIEMILVRFTTLEHLILDGCSLFRGDLRERDWIDLGKRCALVGVRKAKEREKAFKAWLETQSTAPANLTQGADGSPAEMPIIVPRTKKGRRGVATATISFRDPGPSAATRTGSREQGGASRRQPPKFRVWPPLPSLLSFSTTLPVSVKADKHPLFRAEFEAGWSEGLALLRITRSRLRTSARNGVRLLRFQPGCPQGDEWYSKGLVGLEEVELEMLDEVHLSVRTPVLCFVGAGCDVEHESECGHGVGNSLNY